MQQLKKYEHYETQDFLQDEFFVRWVKQPDFETKAFWTKWLKAYPEKKQQIQAAREIILLIKYEKPHRLSEKEHLNIYEAFLKSQPASHHKTKPFRQKISSFRWMAGIAATLLILLWVTYTFSNIDSNRAVEESPRNEMLVKTTAPGQRLTIQLPDKTMVKLNSNSTLTYDKVFEGKTRNVTLRGEAFFQVARDESKPFIIQLGAVNVKVLGTSFDVRSYEDEEEIKVAVQSGAVAVSTPESDTSYLKPNEMGVYSKSSRHVEISSFDPQKIFGWKDGVLIFDRADMQEITQQIESWYGVHVFVAEDVQIAGLYSGKFDNVSLELVLEGIGYASGFDYRIEGKNIFITKK